MKNIKRNECSISVCKFHANLFVVFNLISAVILISSDIYNYIFANCMVIGI